MLCQNCRRNDANMHFKRIINGTAEEVHLCSDCAQALGYADAFSDFGLGLGDLFGNLLGHSTSLFPENAVRCAMCGSSFADIAESGRLGCAECYRTFYDRLLPSIERIHGKTAHVGKIAGEEKPSDAVPDEKERIRTALNEAVAQQNFERAAQLRDELKALEGNDNDAGDKEEK